MSRFAVAAAVLVCTAALAQEVEETTTVLQVPGLPTMQMNVKVKNQRTGSPAPAPTPAPAQPPPRTYGGDAFAISYAPLGVEASTIKVASPEGAVAQIFADDGTSEGTFSVPFNFKGRGDTYYRFVLTSPDGSLLLDKKYEVKRFLGGTLVMRGVVQQVVVAAPVAVAAQGMPEADFAALVEAVDAAGFGDEKLGVIETAAESHFFSIEQVGKLVDLVAMSSEKIGVVERTRSKIVDRQNSFKLLERFTFSSDKEKVRKLLK